MVTDAMVEAALKAMHVAPVDYMFAPEWAAKHRAKMRAALEAALAAQGAARIDPMQDPMRPTLAKLGPSDEHPAEEVLRKLACWLGVGGYNAPTVDADLFHRKIVAGIEDLRKNAAQGAEPVAWGVPNTRPTERQPFMQLLHDATGCQYPEMLVPLYAAPPAAQPAPTDARSSSNSRSRRPRSR